jgi:hypothetical protein
MTRRPRPITVERRAIAGRTRAGSMSHFTSSFEAEKRDIVQVYHGYAGRPQIGRSIGNLRENPVASRPLAAEVERMLRGGPIRFPTELM